MGLAPSKSDIFPVRYRLTNFCTMIWLFLSYGIFLGAPMTPQETNYYGQIQTADELGHLVRAHRKAKQLTLETVAGLGNVSIRFLSEFERGKETAEIGKILKALKTLGLEVIVQPRGVDTRNTQE